MAIASRGQPQVRWTDPSMDVERDVEAAGHPRPAGRKATDFSKFDPKPLREAGQGKADGGEASKDGADEAARKKRMKQTKTPKSVGFLEEGRGNGDGGDHEDGDEGVADNEEVAAALGAPPSQPVERSTSPVPDEVLRVFQWYQTGPMPLAIERRNLRNAHLALGIDVPQATLETCLSRYGPRVQASGRLELAEFRALIEQLRPLDEVLTIFTRVDLDRSGDIDASELHLGMHLLGLSEGDTPQAKALLARFDADGNEKLELAEFRTLVAELKRYKATQFDEVARAFHRYDRQRTHSIDSSELRAALYSLGLACDSEAANALLVRCDADHSSGKIEIDAFRKLVDQLRTLQASNDDPVLRVFLGYDKARKGEMAVHDLRAAIEHLRLPTANPQAASMLARYGTDFPAPSASENSAPSALSSSPLIGKPPTPVASFHRSPPT